MLDMELLTPIQVALCLSVSTHTLQGWRSNSIGPKYIKLGSGINASVRYRSDELESWLNQHPLPTDNAEGHAA